MKPAGGGLARSIRYGIVIAVGCAVVLGGLALYLHARNLALSRRSVTELLTQADHAISTGFYREATPYLEQAMRSASTRDSWLSIAKRAYEIANATHNYGLLLQVGTRGTSNLPGSQQLWAIRVLAQARGGDPSGAEATARRHLTDPEYQSLATEAILRAHPNLTINGTSISQHDRKLIETLTSRSPTLFENLAKEVHNQDLLFDAALLYALKGDYRAASTLLLTVGGAENPKAGMLVNYDAGRYNTALSYYEGIPPSKMTADFELLADDIRVLQDEPAKAAAAYAQFIAQNPRKFWTPYVNMAWLAATNKNAGVSEAKAMALLKRAASLFPSQREVVMTLATLEREQGDLASAGSLLSTYLKGHPSDLDANLLLMKITGASESSARLSSRLWELFYQAKGAARDRVARFLASYLLGIDDYSGVGLLLRQIKNGEGSDWIPFYRGIEAAARGNYTASAAQFAKAYQITPRWQALYNEAIVDLRAGDARSAAEILRKADSEYSANGARPDKSPQRAAIYVALADAFEQMGNLEAAKREALYARGMDANSLSAGLLLKKLDSTAQK